MEAWVKDFHLIKYQHNRNLYNSLKEIGMPIISVSLSLISYTQAMLYVLKIVEF